MDAVKEDMQVVGVREADTKNSLKWKTVIRCGDPCKGKSRKEKTQVLKYTRVLEYLTITTSSNDNDQMCTVHWLCLLFHVLSIPLLNKK